MHRPSGVDPFTPVRRPVVSETLLAFDVGARRIGVAVGNDLVRHAQPLALVAVGPDRDGLAEIGKLVDEWRPQRLVVGIPLAAGDGEAGVTESLRRCERFARRVAEHFALPVERVDERYSSIDADEIHRARRSAGLARRARALDDVAAQVILQRYLDGLPDRGAPT